ncbi:hypothetical protein PWEIH_00420 [Listeria weihenstephanensis FSL R9-0317]|uniref:DUF4435 domain-containing protein n=1 Tax=Listeria weihenstephanensis TaxID=1006155 RepID=UPI0003E8B4F0|nr:DUF4435 domain-containing protein [Listeria weihenstephanensis]EUJ41482.1 hypothetical protein PWEIH_00420 [Listeria weihenstephanensis FSL R9-0317]
MGDSPPVRKPSAYLAQFYLRSTANRPSFTLFVEDEKTPNVYRTLVKRKFKNENVYVFPLGAKSAVIKQFKEWYEEGEQYKDKCLFIVDRDFDFLKGRKLVDNLNLLELTRYTIENYFLDKEVAISLINTYRIELTERQILDKLRWEDWLQEVVDDLTPLFLNFGLAHLHNLGTENCSSNPYGFFQNLEPKVNLAMVDAKCKEVQEKCADKKVEYNKEVGILREKFCEEGEINFHKLIKGKFLFRAMLLNINSICQEKK